MHPEQADAAFRRLDENAVRRWPLPMPRSDGDKEERGRALIVAGSSEMPGVAVLCASAALRAGAGKVTIATGAATAAMVALAMPECRVLGLREIASGGFVADAALEAAVESHDAILIGPGMQDEGAVLDLVGAVSTRGAMFVLDALAMGAVRTARGASRDLAQDAEQGLDSIDAAILITPHAGELAHLTGKQKDDISADAQGAALTAARQWGAIVALKGATTHIATPAARGWWHSGGSIGLSASGTGDTLAGIIVGLAARGAPLEQAAAWAVVLHALAGKRLESRFGPLGYLAREIAGEIPALLHELRVPD